MLNAIVVIFFACFLLYTLVAETHLNGLARDFVTEKTYEYSNPIVEVADESLNTPMIQKLLSAEQLATARSEIANYQNDPEAYIADLTRNRKGLIPAMPGNPLLAKVAAIKEKIRSHYDKTLEALIADLRIFLRPT